MSEIGSKTWKTLVDIKKLMTEQGRLPMPSREAILMDSQFASFKEQLEIVEKYKTGSIHDVDITILQEDLVKLAALNINSGINSGQFNGIAANTEDEVRLAKSKAAYEAKALKEDLEAAGDKVKLSDKDVESLARIKAQNAISQLGTIKIAAEVSKAGYYSIQKFIDVLIQTINMQRGELKNYG
jgi:hypothetical protein